MMRNRARECDSEEGKKRKNERTKGKERKTAAT
jgi:hypothetical protein